MSTNEDNPRFNGVSSLIGKQRLEALSQAHFLIIGLGGVGSWAVEALARSGVGKLTLVDLDDICVSNTNRQLHALDGNYGQMKAEVLAERVKKINPDCIVEIQLKYFNYKNEDEIFSEQFDMVIDGIDTSYDKCHLIDYCKKKGQKLVVCGAVAGRTDPTKITIKDLSKTTNDSLLRVVRKRLKSLYRYPLGKSKGRVKTVFSTEQVTRPQACDTGEVQKSSRLDCAGGLGTTTYMTGSFGFFLAYAAIDEYLEQAK